MIKKTAILVGCGGISRSWLKALARFNDIEIVGLVDLNPNAALERQKEFGLDRAEIATSLPEMLAKIHPDIVFDCTIPDAHRNTTITALNAGCHVLGEKPMAPNMTEAKEMIQAAARSGKVYAVIQNRRYLDRINDYRDLLKSGGLGNLTTLNADFYVGPHFGGFREQMEHVLLLDMAIHCFDEARFISEADPVSVYCHEFNPAGSWYHQGASAMAIFTMSDGSVFNFRGSWCAQGLPTSWNCTWRACCTVGTALGDGEDNFSAEKVNGSEGFLYPVNPVASPSTELRYKEHAGVIREFLDSLAHGPLPQTICTDNIKSLAMVHAAIESSEKKQLINLG